MVLQAKAERRQRHQTEKSCKNNDESHSSTDSVTTGHPQRIPPPSEPVLPADNKVLASKAANDETSAIMARDAVHFVPECNDVDTQSAGAQFTEDKSEARHHSAAMQKGN